MLDVLDVMDVTDVMDVMDVMRRVLLCMLEAVESQLSFGVSKFPL